MIQLWHYTFTCHGIIVFKSYPRAMNCLKELSKKTAIKLRVSTTAGINTTALVIIVNRNNNSTMYTYTLEHTCTVYKYIVFTFSCLKTQIQKDTINTCTYMHMFCTYLYVNTYVYMLYIQTHTHIHLQPIKHMEPESCGYKPYTGPLYHWEYLTNKPLP